MLIEKKVKLVYNGEKVEKVLVFKEVDYETAKKMMLEKHYSHKWNTSFGKVNVGVFENDVLYGIASFGNLMNPKSYQKISKDFKQSNVIELNRLWVDDYLGGNVETTLLGASWKIMREKYPEIKVVQSFADGRLGVGTIYKASSFDYYGFSKTEFFENKITGKIYHNVPFDNTMRPDGMIKLNAMLVRGELKRFEVKTYRYIKKIQKNVTIDLEQKPYPEYEKSIKYLDDVYKNKTIARAFILSYLLDYDEYKDFVEWGKKNIDELVSVIENESLNKIAKSRGKVKKFEDFKKNIDLIFQNKNSSNFKQLSFI